MAKFLLSCLGLSLLWAFAPARAAINVSADDAPTLKFYLMTVDVGTGVADNFGHTGIRVVADDGRDLVFNWGLYDFKDPVQFSIGFYFGDIIYQLGAYPFHYMLAQYKRERRTLWQEELLLTADEKKILWNRLLWNLKPENKGYRYHYFYDNCSTRPRNYIDEALGGVIKNRFANESTGLSFRHMVRSHYATNPFVALSLDILMNSNIDKVMSAWEKMFLPDTLRRNLLEFRREDGSLLLGDTLEHYSYPSPVPYSWSGHQMLVVLMIALLLPAFVSAGRCRQRLATTPSFWRWLSLAAMPFGLYTGLLGVFMGTNWMFSGHLDLHHNVNMLLILPFNGYLFVMGIYWLRRGRPLPVDSKIFLLIKGYLWLQLVSMVVALGIYGAGVSSQELNLVITYLVPINLVFILVQLLTIRLQGQSSSAQ